MTEPRHRHPDGSRAVRQPPPPDVRRVRAWWSVLLADLATLLVAVIAVFGPQVAPHIDVPQAEQLPTITGQADGHPPILRATSTVETSAPPVEHHRHPGRPASRTVPMTSTSASSATSTTPPPGLPQQTTPPPPPAAATTTSTTWSTSTSTTTVTETTTRDCADPAVQCACDLDPLIDCAGNVRLTSTPASTTPPETTTPEVPLP
jgi:hypothetical protein